jgi:hypothetical protein
LGSENKIKKEKFHEAAVMHIEDNVISRPSWDIPPLWHSMLLNEKMEMIKEKAKKASGQQRKTSC